MSLSFLMVYFQAMAEGELTDSTTIPAVDCVINPYQVADLASPVPGVIHSVDVERSQEVRAGQTIASLDANVEQANVELARFRAEIKSEIKLGQVNRSFDIKRKQRVDNLKSQQLISEDNADEVAREAELSQWRLEQAQDLAKVRQLELRLAEAQLAQKTIQAPFDGYILDIFKYRGEYVEEQPILRLAQLDPLIVEAIVPMESFGQIQPGMEADILPDLQGNPVRGKVTVVDRIGDTASNTFGVRLVIPNPDHRIPAGMKCVAKFQGEMTEQLAITNMD